MQVKQKYQVYAVGTHCAAVDVYATSPEEAIEIAGQIDGWNFDVVQVYGGTLLIEEAVLASETDDIGKTFMRDPFDSNDTTPTL